MCKNLKDIIKFYSDIIWHYSIVILGFIPRIHEKQPLSRHYRACPDNLDPRNKSEDDYRKKMSVKPEDDKKLVKFEYDNLVAQCGRSMIEMLGVLAIIGVLSVGGIAGYSSAMEKWKLNETLVGYNHLIYGLLEYEVSLRTLESGSGHYLLEDVISSLNLLPENWKKDDYFIYDPAGNRFRPFIRHNRFVFDVYIGNTKKVEDKSVQDAFSYKMCLNLMSNLLKPMHNLIYMTGIYRDSGYNKYLYGDSSCDNEGQKCLSDATLSDMQNICNSCVLNEEFCIFLIEF